MSDVYAIHIGLVLTRVEVVGSIHNTGMFVTDVKFVIGTPKIFAKVRTIRSPASPED